jgi:Sec-independent protein secretion pathway component TatC
MRYLIAMVCAVIAALISAVYFASPIASWAVRQFTFDSPDTVANLHAATFMLVNVAALAAGFLIGWIFGRSWREVE